MTPTIAQLDNVAPEALAALERAMTASQQESANSTAASTASAMSSKAEGRAESRYVDLHAVPLLDLEDAQGAFSWLDPKFPIAWKQQVRHLRTKLAQFDRELKERGEAGLCVVTLSSLNGKRTRHSLAANLGYALASVQDERVLVVDAKWNRADLGRALGLEDALGLCDASRAPREAIPACMRRIRGTQLYLMPAGQASKFDLEPVDMQGLQRLLSGLRKQFGWIVIDGPGFDTPADAVDMTACADGTVFVVERERDHFQAVSDALRHTKGRYVVGAVLL